MKKMICNLRFISLVCFVLVCSILCSYYLANSKDSPKTVLMSASWAYNYSDLEDLTQNSNLIAQISVEDSNFYTTDYGIPMTNYTVNVITPIYGCIEGDSVNLVMTGGPDGDVLYEIADDPLMSIHDDFIVFARQNDDGTYTVLSGSQGRMSVENNFVSSLNVSNSQVRTHNVGSNISIQNIPLNDFIAEVRSYID